MHYYHGCDAYSKKTLKKIREKGFHYLAQVKGNNKHLLQWIQYLIQVNPIPQDTYAYSDTNNHGRHEYRRCEIYHDTFGIDTKEWKDVKTIIQITSGVQKSGKNFCTLERHYYISSYESDAQTFASIVRKHWHIENALHYVKDVSFYEDSSRMRTGQIPLVATTLRSLAISVMHHLHFKNLKQMRKVLAWEPQKLFSLFRN